MTTIPPGARQYLSYLPTIASYIQSGRAPSAFEISMLQMFASDAYQALRALTYEQLAAAIGEYREDPEYGRYVQLALSPKGEAWIRDALTRLRAT
jgi:hypothetical protein